MAGIRIDDKEELRRSQAEEAEPDTPHAGLTGQLLTFSIGGNR